MTDPGTSPEAAESADPTPQQPMLRVVSPHATAEEVAALVAVLSTLGGGEEEAVAPLAEWRAPHRAVRRTVAPTRLSTLAGTRGGWRSSGLPR